MSRHVIEALGKTRVVIEDERVVEVGEPLLEYCPLFSKRRNIVKITSEAVRENIEFRIKDFGMCARSRKMRMRDFLNFGTSEMLMMAVQNGMLDCAVIACDGAGTVIVTEPEMIQGIGGRISGMVETSPIEEIIAAIGPENVLDPETARMDMREGVEMAREKGYRRIGVTIALPEDAIVLRERFGDDVVIFAVHTTGLNRGECEALFDNCDVITSCASLHIREIGQERKAFQVGRKIPTFAPTEKGIEICRARLQQTGMQSTTGSEDPPRPLI